MHQFFPSCCMCLLVLAMGVTVGKTQPPPLEDDKTLRTESVWMYPIEAGKSTAEPYLSAKYFYDREGRLLRSTAYGTDAAIHHEYYYRYRNNRRERYFKLKDGDEFVDQVETYNAEEQLLSRINYNHQGQIENKLTVEYDAQGQKVKEHYLEHQEGTMKSIYTKQYYYNTKNKAVVGGRYDHHIQNIHHKLALSMQGERVEAYRVYSDKGPLLQTTKFVYSPQGRLLSKALFAQDDELSMAWEYRYEGGKMYASVYESDSRELVQHVLHQYEYYQ